MQFRAELNYTIKDMRQFQTLHQKVRSKVMYYLTRGLAVVAVAMVFFAGGVMIYYRGWSTELMKYYLLLLLFTILWLSLRPVRLRAALKSLQSQGVILMSADDEKVRVKANAMSSEYSYEVFYDIVHYKDTYYLYIDKYKAQIIPERCFVEGDPAAFGKFIEEKTGLKVKEIK